MISIEYDLLLTDLTILTADPARPLLRDGAIGIAGNRLAYVGEATGLPVGTAAN